MDCDSTLHDELKNMREPACPFCDRLLVEAHKAAELCCSKQDMNDVNGKNTCTNCGVVHSDIYVTDKFDFYENLYKIRKKSIYHRKYHIENLLFNISSKNNIELNI